jgi:hypothetical protein
MRAVGWLTIGLGLACAGVPDEPPPTPMPPQPPASAEVAAPAGDWIAAAVDEALSFEVMPGTTGEEDDGTRAAALRTFFETHPEYSDPARREALAMHACGLDGTEAAHEFLVNPPPKEPVLVDVVAEDWKVFVTHADSYCTSDDWGWYSAEAGQFATARGAVTAGGSPTNDVVIVRREGTEVARAPLSGQGWLMLRSGKPAEELPYDPSFQDAMEAYLGAAAR